MGASGKETSIALYLILHLAASLVAVQTGSEQQIYEEPGDGSLPQLIDSFDIIGRLVLQLWWHFRYKHSSTIDRTCPWRVFIGLIGQIKIIPQNLGPKLVLSFFETAI